MLIFWRSMWSCVVTQVPSGHMLPGVVTRVHHVTCGHLMSIRSHVVMCGHPGFIWSHELRCGHPRSIWSCVVASGPSGQSGQMWSPQVHQVTCGHPRSIWSQWSGVVILGWSGYMWSGLVTLGPCGQVWSPHVHQVTCGHVWSPLVHQVTCGPVWSSHHVTCGQVCGHPGTIKSHVVRCLVIPGPSGRMWSGVVTPGLSVRMWSGEVTPGPSGHMWSSFWSQSHGRFKVQSFQGQGHFKVMVISRSWSFQGQGKTYKYLIYDSKCFPRVNQTDTHTHTSALLDQQALPRGKILQLLNLSPGYPLYPLFRKGTQIPNWHSDTQVKRLLEATLGSIKTPSGQAIPMIPQDGGEIMSHFPHDKCNLLLHQHLPHIWI